MRALVDVNVYISYLLMPFGDRTPNIIVDQAFAGAYTLLLTRQLTDELVQKVHEKPYLATRVAREELDAFLAELWTVAEEIAASPTLHPPLGRDPKDEYLIAHAVAGRADYLVSGDGDLLTLRSVAGVQIVSPAAFARMLRQPDPELTTGAPEPVT